MMKTTPAPFLLLLSFAWGKELRIHAKLFDNHYSKYNLRNFFLWKDKKLTTTMKLEPPILDLAGLSNYDSIL